MSKLEDLHRKWDNRVVRKNVIRQSNQMDTRETIAKCRAFSDSFRS